METENPWKLKSTAIVYENKWIKVHEDRAITPTGTNGLYGYIESNDSVVVVVLNDKDEIYLIRKYGYPQRKWMWSLPGGGGDKEDLLVASKRELEEETGIRAKIWDRLGETDICTGLMSERMAVYLARDVSFTGEQEHSDEKISTAKFVPRATLDEMILRGEFDSGQGLAALYLLTVWQAKH